MGAALSHVALDLSCVQVYGGESPLFSSIVVYPRRHNGCTRILTRTRARPTQPLMDNSKKGTSSQNGNRKNQAHKVLPMCMPTAKGVLRNPMVGMVGGISDSRSLRRHLMRVERDRLRSQAARNKAVRSAYSEKMRDVHRRARRDVKYSRLVLQGGVIAESWNFDVPGYHTRSEFLMAKKELTKFIGLISRPDVEDNVEEQAPRIVSGLQAAAGIAKIGYSFLSGDNVRNIAKTSENVANAAMSLNQSIQSITDMFSDIYKNFCKYVPIGVAAAFIVAFAFWIRGTGKCPPMLWTAVCAAVAYYLGEELYLKVKQYFEEKEVEEQSGFGAMATAVAVVLAAKHSVVPWKFFNTASVLYSVGMVPKASEGLAVVFEWVVEVAQKVINSVRSMCNLPEIKYASKYSDEIVSLIERTKEAELEELKSSHDDGPQARYIRLNQLHAEAIGLRRLYIGQRDIQSILDNIIRTCARLTTPLKRAVGAACGYTQQPLSVVLYGKSGVGKTMMVQNLCTAVLKQAQVIRKGITKEEASKLVFLKPFNTEYMDGYHGQPVYLLDDFMMKKPTPNDTTNGLLDLMTYYSPFSTLCNMAMCEDKGNNPFSSKIILMTTNLTHLDECNTSQIMLHPPAIQRRVDIHYEVCVRPQFRKPGSHELDYAKFEIEAAKIRDRALAGSLTTLEAYPWHVWEIFRTSWEETGTIERVPGTGRPFHELLFEMVDGLELRKDSHLKALESADIILTAELSDEGARARMRTLFEEQSPEIVPHDPSYVYAWAKDVRAHNVVSDDDALSDTTEWDEYTVRNAISKVRDFFSGLISTVAKWMVDSPGWLAMAAVVTAATVALLVKICTAAWSWVTETFFGVKVEEQSNRPTSKAVKYQSMTMQSGSIQDEEQKLVYNNTYKLIVYHKDDSDHTVLGQILFTHRDYAVFPLHFIDRIRTALGTGVLDDQCKLVFRSCRSAGNSVDVKVGHFMKFPREEVRERDLCFMRLPGLIHIAKDVRKFILLQSDLVACSGLPARLDTARVEKNGELVEYNSRLAFMSHVMRYGTNPVLIGSTRHQEWLQYYAATIVGDCGAPVCLQSSRRTVCRVLGGLHVGARALGIDTCGTMQGYATVLTQEIVSKYSGLLAARTADPVMKEASFAETCQQAGIIAPKGFDVLEASAMPFKGSEVSEEEQQEFGSFTGVGTVTVPVSAPVKTSFKRTFVSTDCLFEEVMPNFSLRPVRLAPHMDGDNGLVYPMVNALKPYAGGVRSIDVELFTEAVFVAMKPFKEATTAFHGRVWTTKEALVGANGAKGIPLGTSAGLPGCVAFKNKRTMLGGVTSWEVDTPEIQTLCKEVEALEVMIKEGVRPCFLVRGFLKDELRKPGKSARYIAGTNVHYYVLCRKYFGQIVTCQMMKYKDCGMCPGINPYQDWEWLHNFLREKGDYAWDGDFTGFDTSQQPQMLAVCLKFINEWYSYRGATKEENDVRTILFLDLMKSLHVVGRGSVATHVVQWQRSLPSGHFLTTFINSMLSMSCMVASFMKTTSRHDFWECCRAATLGDDNLCCTNSEVLESFNQKTVAKVLLEEFGMVYTAGRKGEELTESVPWDKLVFLQRTFRLKQDCLVGPIRMESILGCLLYAQKGDPSFVVDVMKQNIEGALSELSLHTEEEWQRVVPSILEVARSIEYDPLRSTSSSQDYFRFTCSRQDTGWF